MSTTYTSNTKLAKPALGDTGWSTPLNLNCDTLDGFAPLGGLCVTLAETPSASLNVKVAAGNVVAQDGSIVTYGGATSQAVTASSTRYLYLDGPTSWALSVGTTFPTTPHVRLATVSTGASAISSITDSRQAFNVAGSFKDGTAWSVGLTNGLTIGTAVSQKLGFYGATAIAQSTGGSNVASSSWTTVSQDMLNKAYSTMRNLGLLS